MKRGANRIKALNLGSRYDAWVQDLKGTETVPGLPEEIYDGEVWEAAVLAISWRGAVRRLGTLKYVCLVGRLAREETRRLFPATPDGGAQSPRGLYEEALRATRQHDLERPKGPKEGWPREGDIPSNEDWTDDDLDDEDEFEDKYREVEPSDPIGRSSPNQPITARTRIPAANWSG